MKYVSDYEAKEMICEYGKRIYDRGFVDGNGGNITYRVGDNEVWVTPTMESKGFLNLDMLVKLDLDGNILSKSEYKSSSEVKMHLGVLRSNKNLHCLIHAHPTFATTLAVIGEDIPCDLLPEAMAYFGDYIPIAPFAMPGTNEVPESVIPFCKENTHAVLLANHGALTFGKTMKEAWFAMEVLENYCHVYILTKSISNQPKGIPGDRLKEFKEILNKK